MIFTGLKDARTVKIIVPTGVSTDTSVTATIANLNLPAAYNDSVVTSWNQLTSAGVVVDPTGGKCLQAAGTITISEATAGFTGLDEIFVTLQIGAPSEVTGASA